jgi:hypothetical protein
MVQNEVTVDEIRKLALETLEILTALLNNDRTVTWTNAWLMQRRLNLLRLKSRELTNTLFAPDIDPNLIEVLDCMLEQLVAHCGRRNFDFEREYTHSHDISGRYDAFRNHRDDLASKYRVNIFGNQYQENSGLSRLGKLNIFGRQL